MPEPLSDREILNLAEQAIQDGRQWNNQFETDRRNAMRAYLARPYGDEMDGKSKAVLSDVADTIEWYLPSLIRSFMSTTNIVSFQPIGREDEKAADQEGKYCHHVLWRKNDGFNFLYSWFKDALLLKTGIAKVWWCEESHTELERYRDMPENELMQLLANPDVEEVSRETVILVVNDPQTGRPIQEQRYDVSIRRFTNRDRVKIEGVPAEEFFVSPETTQCLDEAPYVVHRQLKTRSQLLEMGFDEDIVQGLGGVMWDTHHKFSPHRDRGGRSPGTFQGSSLRSSQSTSDPSTTLITVDECYIRMDVDGDGRSELVQVWVADNQLLYFEEWGGTIPFVAICPVPMPHEFYGRSLADMTVDLQYLRTQTIRQMMDNMHRTNNSRWEVPDAIMGKDTIDDLLTDTAGGVVRTEGQGGILPLTTPVTWQHGQQVLEFLGLEEQRRVGLTPFNLGQVPDPSESGRTATGSHMFRKAANQRVDTVTRIFGEGLAKLYLKIHENARRYQDTETILKIDGEYVSMDPATWRERTDLDVRVGMGATDAEEQIAALMNQFQLLMGYAQHPNPEIQAMAQPENFYAINKEMLELSVISAPERFITPIEEARQIAAQAQQAAMQQQQQMMAQQAQMQQAMMQLQAQMQMMQDQAKEQAKSEAEILRIQHQTRSDLVEGDAEHEQTLAENYQKHLFAMDEKELESDSKKAIAAFQTAAQLADRSNGQGGDD